MSMATASRVFSFARHRARARSNRVPSMEEEHHVVPAATADDTTDNDLRLREEEENNETSRDVETGDAVVETSSSEEEEETEAAAADEENTSADGILRVDDGLPHSTMSLAELQEERELARRRSSGCVMLMAFILFRLWFAALAEGDVFLLMMALVGTAWTARWVQHNREREEELDRRIAAYLRNNPSGNPEATRVDRNDLRLLSFQAQLALAIMESQRQMMEGGHGGPDGQQANPGVSEEARSHWSRFKYRGNEKRVRRLSQNNYGSVPNKDHSDALKQVDDNHDDEEEPHCSICLGEYENDETLVKLPCSHVYHDECISSWTSNHVKCPLCNFDLESVDATATEDSTTSSTMDDSIV